MKIALYLLLGILFIWSLRFAIRSRILRVKAKRKLSKLDLESTEPWSTEFLESKRQITDPIADEVVKRIMEGNEKAEINQMFQSIVVDDDQLPDDAPTEVKNSFSKNLNIA